MTKNVLKALFLIALFSVPGFAQDVKPTATPPPENQEEIIRISSDLVLIDALVLDKDGKQVTDLQPEDFEVWQDGNLQKITNFSYVSSENAATSATKNPSDGKKKNAVAQVPSNVRSNTNGRIITFIIDDGNCLASPESINVAREGVIKFIDEQMSPDDKVSIYRTRSGSSLLQLYTSNKEILKRQARKAAWFPSACGSAFDAAKRDENIKATGGGQGSFENENDKEFRQMNEQNERDNQVIGTVGVINFVVERLKNLPSRKVVFLLSDGLMTTSNKGTVQTRAFDALREVADKASRASVVIYTLSAKGLNVPGFLSAQDDISPGITGGADNTEAIRLARIEEETYLNNGMSYLAYSTGGEFLRNRNFLDTGVREVLKKESGHYLLGYQPNDETFKGKNFHKIEVRVKRPELRVSSRRGFYGRENESVKTKYKSADSPLYQAIASPLQQNGMDVRLTTLLEKNEAKANTIRALLHLKGKDLTFTDDAKDTKKASIDVVAVLLDEKGKVIEEFNRSHTFRVSQANLPVILQNGLIYTADFPVKKEGVYSFRIVVRDNQSKTIGSAGDFLEIPNLKKKDFYLSSFVTTTVSKEGKPFFTVAKDAKDAISPALITSVPAIRQYAPSEILAYTYNVYNAKLDNSGKPKLTTQTKLYKNGKLIAEGKETPSELEPQADYSALKDFGYLRLNPQAEAGEYILQLVVKDTLSNKTVSQWIDFEVVK